MKRLIAFLAVVMVVGGTAFAGPILGMTLNPDPSITDNVGFTIGWAFSAMNLEVTKADLATWLGDWGVGLIWTPPYDGFGYRAGARIDLEWSYSSLVYQGITFVLGARKELSPFVFYGDLELSSTGSLAPVLGVNFRFDDLTFPNTSE